MKEKSITELLDEKRTIKNESVGIIETARRENRALNTAENEKLNRNTLRMQEINAEIMGRREMNEILPQKRDHQGSAFSLRRAILAMAERREQSSVEMRVIEEGRQAAAYTGQSTAGGILLPTESRAALSAGGVSGIVDTDTLDVILPLQAALVLAKAGATFVTGLRGNVAFPSYSGTKIDWVEETGSAGDGTGTITAGKTFTPHRLSAYVDISKQLLIQDAVGIEMYIRRSIAEAMAAKIEEAAFAATHDNENAPSGLFVGFDKAEADFDWEGVVTMETDLETQNALTGRPAYIMHPSLVVRAKTTVKDTSGADGFVLGDKERAGLLNGYPLLRTSNIPKGIGTGKAGFGAVFGNWSDFFVGQWGAVELLVDPYTQATKGTVRLVVNSYWDLGAIRDESFVLAAFK